MAHVKGEVVLFELSPTRCETSITKLLVIPIQQTSPFSILVSPSATQSIGIYTVVWELLVKKCRCTSVANSIRIPACNFMLHLVQLYVNIQLEYSFQNAKLNDENIWCCKKYLPIYTFASRNVSISLFGDFIFLLFCSPVNDQCVLRLHKVILNIFFYLLSISPPWHAFAYLLIDLHNTNLTQYNKNRIYLLPYKLLQNSSVNIFVRVLFFFFLGSNERSNCCTKSVTEGRW